MRKTMRIEIINEIKNEIRNEMRNEMKNDVRNNVLSEDKTLSVIIDLISSFLMRVVSIFSNLKDEYVQFS
jgi:single-stranded DNA-specific DHH superfamily exonuclease